MWSSWDAWGAGLAARLFVPARGSAVRCPERVLAPQRSRTAASSW